jgi:hypothetical protein
MIVILVQVGCSAQRGLLQLQILILLKYLVTIILKELFMLMNIHVLLDLLLQILQTPKIAMLVVMLALWVSFVVKEQILTMQLYVLRILFVLQVVNLK